MQPLNTTVFVCFLTADDVRAEANHQQEGAGTAAGHSQPGQLPEPASHAERHDGRWWTQPDGPPGAVPAVPRHGPSSGHGQESRAFQRPVGQRDYFSVTPSPPFFLFPLPPSLAVQLPVAQSECDPHNKHNAWHLGAQSRPVHGGKGGEVWTLDCCPPEL